MPYSCSVWLLVEAFPTCCAWLLVLTLLSLVWLLLLLPGSLFFVSNLNVGWVCVELTSILAQATSK